MKRHGLTWHDVIMVPVDAPQPPPQPPNWRVMVHQCLVARAVLTPKELAFVRNLVAWQRTPSPRQIAWLTRIFENLP